MPRLRWPTQHGSYRVSALWKAEPPTSATYSRRAPSRQRWEPRHHHLLQGTSSPTPGARTNLKRPQQTLPPTISLASTFTKNPSSSPSSGNPLAALLARLQDVELLDSLPIVVKSLWGVVALFVLLVVSGVIGSLVGSRRNFRDERYPNGALRARGRVRQDPQKDLVLVGRWTYWYPNGQKEAEGDYREARDSGKRGATGLLMDGREGPWILWHPKRPEETGGHLQFWQVGRYTHYLARER